MRAYEAMRTFSNGSYQVRLWIDDGPELASTPHDPSAIRDGVKATFSKLIEDWKGFTKHMAETILDRNPTVAAVEVTVTRFGQTDGNVIYREWP